MVAQIPTAVFTTALDQVYDLAVARTPEAQRDTLTRAKEIARSGKVHLVNAHEAQVLSSDGATWYVTNGACECKDHHFRPETVCKHRMAHRLTQRVHELVAAAQTATATPGECWQPIAEDGTPCHMTGDPCSHQAVDVPPRVITGSPAPMPRPRTERERLLVEGYAEHELVEIKSVWTVKVMGLVRMVHSRYGIERLDVRMDTITEGYALAHAVLVLKDGRTFSEDGVATPKNVGSGVQIHWQTMALTRSKGRVCRNVLCEQAPSTEELGE